MTYENRIVRFFYELDKQNINECQTQLHFLLRTLKNDFYKGGPTDIICLNLLRTLYSMIGYTRDIYSGRGERDLSYMMISVWYQYFPVLAIYAFSRFVFSKDSNNSYGCWNDIKYFCKYIHKSSPKGWNDPLINIAVSFANRQLNKDIENREHSSNVAKWIPKESKNRWLYEKFVTKWFDVYEKDPTVYDFSFQKKKYRNILSKHNRELNPDSLKTNRNIIRGIHTGSHYTKTKNHSFGKTFFHDNIFIGTYIKTAVSLLERATDNADTMCDMIWLNQKWSRLCASFENILSSFPLVNISREVSDENLFHALGFACLIASKSDVKRILLISNEPIWIDVSDCNDFCKMIERVWSFCEYRAHSIVSNTIDVLMKNIEYSNVCNFQMFVFSDNFEKEWRELHDIPGRKFSIVYWKLGHTDIYDDNKTQMDFTKSIVMNGHSACLLRFFTGCLVCGEQTECAYSFICRIMNDYRYQPLSEYFDLFCKNI